MIATRFNPLGKSDAKPYAYRVAYVRGHFEADMKGLYVVSNYIPQLDDHFIFEMDNPVEGSSSYFGTCDVAWRRYAFATYYNNAWIGETNKALGVSRLDIKKLEYKNRKTIANDSVEVDFSEATEEPTKPLNIFAMTNTSNQSGNYFSNYDFKNIEVYRDGQLYRHFIPVVDRDGNASIYEEVEGVFLYGQSVGGSWTLTAGERI